MSVDTSSAIQASLNAALEETLEEVLILTNLVNALGEVTELPAMAREASAADLH